MRALLLPLGILALLCGCDEGEEPVQAAGPPAVRIEIQPATPPKDGGPNVAGESSMSAQPVSGKYNELTDFESWVIVEKGTERAWVGEYTDLKDPGTYICRRCNAPLYRSDDKFNSHCGWPSFDDEIDGAVTQTVDEDGYRTEITCSNCGGHLGHVFVGEGFTSKDTRHCVNSVSMKFVAKGAELPPVIRPESKTP